MAGSGLSLVRLADAKDGRFSDAMCREEAGRQTDHVKEAGWCAIRATGQASTTPIDARLAWERTTKAPATQRSIVGGGIWPGNGLAGRKREEEKRKRKAKKRKERKKEERERKSGGERERRENI